MADDYISTDPNAGESGYVSTDPNAGLSQVPPSQMQAQYVRQLAAEPSGSDEQTQKFDVEHPVIGAAARAVGEAAQSVPGMIAQFPEQAYQGYKLAAGTPQQRVETLANLTAQGLAQGQQIAQDVAAPLGTEQSFRGLINLGMLAAPGISEFGIHPLLKPLFGVEAPPIQTLTPETDAVARGVTPEQMGQTLGRNWTGTPPATTEPNPIVDQVNRGLDQMQAERAAVATPIDETLAQARGEPTQTFPSISQSAEEQRRADLIRQQRAQQPNVNIETGQQFFPERGTQTQGLQTEGTQRIGEPNASQIQETADRYGNRGTQPEGVVQAEPGTTENVPSTTTRLRGNAEEGAAGQGEARQGTQARIAPENIPSDATVKLNVRTEEGGVEPTELNAREAHDALTRERDAYRNMLDCLAA